MCDLSIVELQFNYRAFIAYLNELLRLQGKGEKNVDEKPIEKEIQRTENMLRFTISSQDLDLSLLLRDTNSSTSFMKKPRDFLVTT